MVAITDKCQSFRFLIFRRKIFMGEIPLCMPTFVTMCYVVHILYCYVITIDSTYVLYTQRGSVRV